MKVEAHQRSQIDTAKKELKTAYENELNNDLQQLEQKNSTLLTTKQKLEQEGIDEIARYKQAKLNKNMFEDDEIEEISTPAVLESSRT
jgi:hypothetical protein